VCGYTGERHVPAEIATGDLGHFDADGFLHIAGRRKNVFITSFGRNVSPEWVETELEAHAAVAQAAVFGEARPWNVAVVVPAPAADATAIAAAIARANAGLPDYARISDWILAHEPFTPANGLLTANGRTRRAAIFDLYRDRIDARYDESVGHWASARSTT
jgi:long-subunit acyl-CoA synthetase (AMP-forming)